jgi:peptide/nickel transport system substrate-binding protein
MTATGEADIAPNIAVQDATDAKIDISYPHSETSRLRIDTTMAPLNDRGVREAVNLATDRDAIRDSISSKGVIPATQLVVPSTNGHNRALKVLVSARCGNHDNCCQSRMAHRFFDCL